MSNVVKIPLPIKGFTDITSYEDAPGEYCVQSLNVRPFDPVTRRLRISQRAGFSKWAVQFGTGQPIQFVRQTNLAQASTAANVTTTYTFVDFQLKDGSYSVPAGTPVAFPFYTLNIAGGRINGGNLANITYSETLPSAYGTTRYDVGAIVNRGNSAAGVDVTFKAVSAAKRYSGLQWSSEVHVKIAANGTATWTANLTNNAGNSSTSSGNITGNYTATDSQFVVSFLPGQAVIQGPNGNITYNPAANQTFGAAELTIATAGSNTTAAADYQVVSIPAIGYHPSADISNPVYLVAQNGGLNIGDPVGGWTTLGGIFNTSGEISCVDAFGKAYVVDGSHIVVVDLATKTSAALVASGGSTLPSGPRLATLYRGRLVLSRTLADPWNWFMSKIGDPTNWDYSNLSPAGAVSGNDADAGRIGDIITALIPFADTYMIIGCPSSIYIMRGDPKAGGTIDLLSNQVGITGPLAWTQSPDGTVYFMSRKGLYKIPRGASECIALSTGKVEKYFSVIDIATFQFQLGWNGDDDTVLIAPVPTVQTSPQQAIVWDSRTEGFWPDVYPYGMGPACMAPAIGKGGALVGSNRRVLLVGGWDGVVRIPDANNFGDDGTAITTLVRFAPVQLGDGDTLGKVSAARFNWGEPFNNFSVTYDYFVANHPQDAALAVVSSHTKVLAGQGGYQKLDRQRVRGGALCLQLSNSVFGTTWSLESAILEVTEAGRMRT